MRNDQIDQKLVAIVSKQTTKQQNVEKKFSTNFFLFEMKRLHQFSKYIKIFKSGDLHYNAQEIC